MTQWAEELERDLDKGVEEAVVVVEAAEQAS